MAGTTMVRTGVRRSAPPKPPKRRSVSYQSKVKRKAGRAANVEHWSQSSHTVHINSGKGQKGYSRTKTKEYAAGGVNMRGIGGRTVRKTVRGQRTTTIHNVSARKGGAAVGVGVAAAAGGAYAYSKSKTHARRKAAAAARPASANYQRKAHAANAVSAGGYIGYLGTKHKAAGVGVGLGAGIVGAHYGQKAQTAKKAENKAARAQARSINKNPSTAAKPMTHAPQKFNSRVKR